MKKSLALENEEVKKMDQMINELVTLRNESIKTKEKMNSLLQDKSVQCDM